MEKIEVPSLAVLDMSIQKFVNPVSEPPCLPLSNAQIIGMKIHHYHLSCVLQDRDKHFIALSGEPIATWQDWIWFLQICGSRRDVEDKLEEQHVQRQSLILAEIIRLRWDSKIYKRLKVKFYTEAKREAKGHATFWDKVINLIQETWMLVGAKDSGFENPGHWFASVWMEGALDPMWLPESDYEIGKAGVLKRLRSENHQLLGLNNPFDPQTAPEAWKLFDSATAQSGRLDEFHSRFYIPAVRARQALATIHSKHSMLMKLSDDDNIIVKRQGRKKVISETRSA